jgi:hypothetical protein
VTARHARYWENQSELVRGMTSLGFSCLLDEKLRSPIITSFLEPAAAGFSFAGFYAALKARGVRHLSGQGVTGGYLPHWHDRRRVSRHHSFAHCGRTAIDDLVISQKSRSFFITA